MMVEAGKTVLARGRVKIEGEAEVLGSRRKEFESDRFVPVYCISDCNVTADEFEVVDGCTIPESWKRLAEKDWEVLFIYGGVDRGKSTLATYLANRVGGAWVLDLDVGQADVAHPGAMGYGYAKDIVSLSEVGMENGYFVGTISPSFRESKCLRGVARLWNELEKLEGRKIVDTTGWIRGRRAKDYKLAKLEIIQPDVVASFEGNPEFLRDWKVFEVESGHVVKRSREERASIRAALYARWMRDGKKLEVRDPLGGKELPKEFLQEVLGVEVEFARRGDDFLFVCLSRRSEVDPGIIRGLRELYEVDEVCVVGREEMRGILVGLYKGRKYLGFGLLSFEGKWVLETPFEDFDSMELGEIRFDGEKEYIVRLPV
ncbi:MAG: Clp1/GlmU family protein [Archaeoglobaceae archaeon]